MERILKHRPLLLLPRSVAAAAAADDDDCVLQLLTRSCGNTLDASARLLFHLTWPSPPDRSQRNSTAPTGSSGCRSTSASSQPGQQRGRRGDLPGGKPSWRRRTQTVRRLVVRPTVRRRPEHGTYCVAPARCHSDRAKRCLCVSACVFACVRPSLDRTSLMLLSAFQNDLFISYFLFTLLCRCVLCLRVKLKHL